MVAREVTKLLKQQLHPLWREWGFQEVTGRSARMVDGPLTVTVQVKSVTKRLAEVAGVPLGSFHADIGLDHGYATGAGFLRPEVLDHDQMGVRAHLSRTPQFSHVGVPDLWFPSEIGVEAAVADVVASFQAQGRRFLDEWSDADRAYALLHSEPSNQTEGGIGVPSLTMPGNPGSTSRLSKLAVLAALRGDVAAEREHLHAHLEQSAHPWIIERLAVLDAAEGP